MWYGKLRMVKSRDETDNAFKHRCPSFDKSLQKVRVKVLRRDEAPTHCEFTSDVEAQEYCFFFNLHPDLFRIQTSRQNLCIWAFYKVIVFCPEFDMHISKASEKFPTIWMQMEVGRGKQKPTTFQAKGDCKSQKELNESEQNCQIQSCDWPVSKSKMPPVTFFQF